MKESSSVCHHYHQSANSQQQLRHTHQRRSPMRSTMNRIDHNSAKKWLNISQKFRLASQLMLLTCLMLMLANQLAEAETSSSLHSSSSQSIPVPTTNSNISKRDLSDSIKLATSNGKQLTDACQVNNGESVAIVEIEESQGSDMNQITNPPELPIGGSVSGSEIELRVESETHKYFRIQDKRLLLTRPLDRDALLKESLRAATNSEVVQNSTQVQQQPISSIYLQLSCIDKRLQAEAQKKKVIIPVLVKVLDLNDNAPKFSSPVYNVQVDELTPVDAIIIDSIQAIDLDSASNGLIEYSLVAGSAQTPSRPTPVLTSRLVQRAQPEVLSATTFASRPATSQKPTGVPVLETSVTSWPISVPEESATTSSVDAVHETITISTRSGPTINLNSEPIVNGPMEEADDESDEALLAAMNSTDAESESDSMILMMPARGGRKRRALRQFTLIPPPQPAKFNSEQDSGQPRDLWTNLMAAPMDESTPAETRSTVGLVEEPQSGKHRMGDRDSLEYFYLELSPTSNRPVIRLKKQLDYESRRVHLLTLMATDKASNKADRLSSLATIVVKVLDGDDQGPAFILDQGGCATGSISQPTSPGPKVASSKKRRDLSDDNAQSRPTLQGQIPKGFKETEENFDFSDIHPSGSDSSDDELDDFHQMMMQSDSPAANQQTSRARRYQENSLDSNHQQTTTTLSPSRQLNPKSHYLDYSCLSGSPSVQTGGQAEYFSTVMSGDSDYLLRVAPQAIKARDRDEINAPIRYSFVNGTPANFSSYFQINSMDASVKQVAPIDKSHIEKLVIWVQAQEQTANKLSSLAKLTIDVLASDKNPPVLIPNSYLGFVDENSPVGSLVRISTESRAENNYSNYLQIGVLDADYSSSTGKQVPVGMYELETTSDAFKVNKDGLLYVNKWPLDRDLPNQAVHILQVTARQTRLASSKSISSPISINVTLLDLNDNPPIITNASLSPIQLSADNRASRRISTIEATDKDLPENSKMFFSILHVSNNGRDRFKIEPDSGHLEALGKFQAGEQFSLTIQASDQLGRVSQGILEVVVVPGANIGGPQFVVDAERGDNSRGYAVEINEGIAVHSTVIQVQAVDPEKDQISYSIVDGNINNDFYINSKTGAIQVANKLDREEVSAYNLLVQARDSGGLATLRPVLISIADNNDQNPIFSQPFYTFNVEEASSVPRIVGKVSASDEDAAENGQISYTLSESPSTSREMFAIDEKSGEITLLESLDYEQVKSYSLIATAKDHGENPRSTTAAVVIRVVDIQDESPYFERDLIQVRVSENLVNQRIAQVQARDPDSHPQITYTIKYGDGSLFEVDPQSGVVSTTARGLDFEESRTHKLLVGTVESKLELSPLEASSYLASSRLGEIVERSALCLVEVTVEDVNDNEPHFVNQPLPVRIQDSAQLGSLVTRLVAEDLDGSEPNNVLKYQLVAKDSSQTIPRAAEGSACSELFMIDSSSGAISVKSDLKRSGQSECQLLVQARDSGQQSLSSGVVSLNVFIDHIAEVSVNSMIGFADSTFTVELEENLPADTVVKVVPIMNKPKSSFPMSCEIVSGNELSKFYVQENEHRDCVVKTRDNRIDYEQRQKYSLTLRLNTIGSSAKTLAQLNINIVDINDNRPVFLLPSRYSQLTQGRFLAGVASDAPSEVQVIQLRAADLDSAHSNGLVSYEILNDNELEARFKIELVEGILRTARPVEDIPSTRLPMRVKVMARDNPEVPSESLSSVVEVVVNLIEDRHRLALAIKDAATGRVLDSKDELLGAIQERTGLIPGLEKAESLKIFRNGTLEPDVSGTDFWFYLIEPGTFRIVPSDDPRIRSALLDPKSHISLLDIIGQTMGFTKAKVRLPYSISHANLARSASLSPVGSLISNNQLASLLILAALLIAISSAIVIIYQCGFWSSLSRANQEKVFLQQQQQAQQASYYQWPNFASYPSKRSLTGSSRENYAFQSAFSTLASQQPSMMAQLINQQMGNKQSVVDQYPLEAASLNKEYETQMLKMSVLFDDNQSVDEHNNCKNLNT